VTSSGPGKRRNLKIQIDFPVPIAETTLSARAVGKKNSSSISFGLARQNSSFGRKKHESSDVIEIEDK